MSISAIREQSARFAGDLTAFLQKLVQTPSISGQEKEVAGLIIEEMKRLDYDEVFADDMGNVVGIIKGSGRAESIMFNGHMDHVDPGILDGWEYSPYSGTVEGGYLHGRGTCDMKGALASHVYAAGIIKKLGLPHRGDIIITGVVQEEPAECVGMAYLCDVTFKKRGLKPGFVVLGEPSDLKVMLGHKGRIELKVTTIGRTSHASAPWRGINAISKMLPVLTRVKTLNAKLPTDALLGKSTISPTIISCSPGRLSVIPDLCTVSLDRRLIPGETPEQAVGQVEKILGDIGRRDAKFNGTAQVLELEETSYTGMKTLARKEMPVWITPQDNPGVVKACAALEESGQKIEFGYWDFATDGSHTAVALGIPTIGYGPGEEGLAHTNKERINLDSLNRSVVGNAAIAMAIAG